MKMLLLLALVLLVMWGVYANAQSGSGALVVASCGTVPVTYAVGSTRQITVNTSGQVCL